MPDVPREWARLSYREPRQYLLELREAERSIAGAPLDKKTRALRAKGQRKYLEARQAALFCHGINEALGLGIRFAHSEERDYDAIATWREGDVQHYAPIQLKEVPPASANPKATVNGVLAGLAKYVDSRELIVAVHVTKAGRLTIDEIQIPDGTTVRQIW